MSISSVFNSLLKETKSFSYLLETNSIQFTSSGVSEKISRFATRKVSNVYVAEGPEAINPTLNSPI